jgi:uncharacterized protein YggE
MKVDGKGKLQVPPDMAIVSLGVSTEDKQLQVAQKQNAEITARVINALHGLGIPAKDIQTQSYSAEPQYDYIEGRQVLRGYQVIHMLKINVEPVEKAGAVIDRAVEAGANVVSSISFTLKDPSRYYQQALDAAIMDAVNKALAMGQKLGVNVQPTPLQLVEKGVAYPTPIPMTVSAFQTTTPIQGGQLEVTAEIEAIFGYYQ